MKKIYTCQEVAKKYNVKVDTVWRWIRTGRMKAVELPRTYAVSEKDIAEFEKARRKVKVYEG